MATVSIMLPSNKTKGIRIALFTRMTKDGFKCAGVLEIRESEKPTTKVYVRRYAVQEQDRKPNERIFKLTKPLETKRRANTSEDDKYHVMLVDRSTPGNFHRCECKSYQKTNDCVHLQALLALRGAGHLPAPAPQPTPAAGTPQ